MKPFPREVDPRFHGGPGLFPGHDGRKGDWRNGGHRLDRLSQGWKGSGGRILDVRMWLHRGFPPPSRKALILRKDWKRSRRALGGWMEIRFFHRRGHDQGRFTFSQRLIQMLPEGFFPGRKGKFPEPGSFLRDGPDALRLIGGGRIPNGYGLPFWG